LRLELLRQIDRVTKVEEILADRILQRDPPQVEEWLIDKQEASVTVVRVREIADEGERRGENSLAPPHPV
jgi:hypothetical protein